MRRARPAFLQRPARRFLRALALALPRLRSRPLSLDPGPLLVVAPHPDHDILGCAGLLLRRRRAGLPVSILYLTDGAASHSGRPDLAPERLAAVRRAEAARILESPVRALWQPMLLIPLRRAARRVHRHSFPGDGRVKSRALAAHVSRFAPTPPWPRPVLPEDFAASVSREEEFFFEVTA